MKLIVAIIRPEKLEAVQDALNEREVYLMTVSNVHGCGRQRGISACSCRRGAMRQRWRRLRKDEP